MLLELGEKKAAKRILDELPKKHSFEMRNAYVENVDWESYATVHSAIEKRRGLGQGWE